MIYVVLAAAWIWAMLVATVFAFAFGDFRPFFALTLAGVLVCSALALRKRRG